MPKIPVIKRKVFEKFLVFLGCSYFRTQGDHIIYKRPDLKCPIIFQAKKDVSFMVLRSNLHTLNLTPDDFIQELKRMKKKK